jgi:arylsulfatase A-like enzyme
MLMRGPGLPAGKRVKAFTQSPDVAPTVTDWLGIGVHPSHTGKSLLPLVRGEVDKLRDFAVSGWFNRSWAIFTEDNSYIHWRKPDDKGTDGVGFYAAGMIPFYVLLGRMGGGGISAILETRTDTSGLKEAAVSQVAVERQLWKQSAAIQQDIWTSTAADAVHAPRTDELYDRKADPFQLKDIAGKDPKKAAELYSTLAAFMDGLRKT